MRRIVNTEVLVEEDGAIDLTPMLDVVFIMLIFFIVTAVFIKEAGVEVIKPKAKTTIESIPTSILIAIDDKNRIWVDGKTVDIRALPAYIERLEAENPGGGLVIQADQRSNIHSFTQVLDVSRTIIDPMRIQLATQRK